MALEDEGIGGRLLVFYLMIVCLLSTVSRTLFRL